MSRDTYRALFISDLHMSNNLPFAKPGVDGVTDRLRHQVEMLGQVRDYTQNNPIHAVFVLGDLFDKRLLDAVTLAATVEAFLSFSVPLFIMPGNHDADTHKGRRFTPEVFASLGDHKNIRYVTGPDPIMVCPWLRFWPLAYKPYAETRETLELIRRNMAAETTDLRGMDVLLFHQAIIGCGHAGWVCDDGLDAEEVTTGFDFVLSGHFHLHQYFSDHGMYLGAPMQHHFGDSGDVGRGFWDISFQRGSKVPVSLDRIPIVAPKFWTKDGLEWTDEDEAAADVGDYIKFQVHATTAEWIAAKPDVDAWCQELRARGYNVFANHKPVYHHTEERMKGANPEVASYGKLLRRYLEVAKTDGLDPDRLLEIGRNALAAVEK